MNTKFISFILFVTLISITVFTSCEDDDELSKPEINMLELGLEDSHVAYQGADFHIEAEIVAEGKIDYIMVEIHPEGEEEEELGHEHEEWEFDSIYTEGFTGLKNATFHKHIDIDATAEAGEYHFHFIVVDMEGNQVTYEGDIEIQEAISNINVLNLSVNGDEHDVSKASGSFIISFDASTESGTLASYSIEVHNHPASGLEEDEFKIIDNEFTDSFSGLTSASVSNTITIDAAAPLGEYHVEIVIVDSEANEKVVSAHIDLED